MKNVLRSIAQFVNRVRGRNWQNYSAVDRVELVINFNAPVAPELWLEQMDNEKQYGMLSLKGGTARAFVRPGKYSLLYRANTHGPSQQYNIEIAEPKSAKWKPDPAQRSDSNARINNVYGNFDVR